MRYARGLRTPQPYHLLLRRVQNNTICNTWVIHYHCTSSGGARPSRQPGHFQVTKVVRQVIICKRQRSKERSQVISRSENPQARSPDALFSSEKLTTFLVVAFITQAIKAADCFTVKIKQIKRSDMVTFLFSVNTITEAKQDRAEDLPARSFDLARPGVAPPLCTRTND